MGKKFLGSFVVVVAGLAFLSIGALAVKATCADAPDEILIQNEGYKRDIKGPVRLNHAKHSVDYGAQCTDCHHVYEDGKNVWKEGDPVKKCSACHDPIEKKGEIDKLRNAYHNNCKDCHKAYLKDHPDSEAPFRKCNNCHQKKS